MSEEVAWALLGVATVVTVMYIASHVRCTWREGSQLSSEVREKSHEAANEITKTRFFMRNLEKHPDPLGELVRRMGRDDLRSD